MAAEAFIRLCTQCGIIAPTERGRCERCDTAFGVQCPTIERNPDGTAWAWMECWINCPCGSIVPLTPAMVGVGIPCGNCGQGHRIDAAEWYQTIELAHGVVDLSPPDPTQKNLALGAHNPFAAIGVTATFAVLPGNVMVTPGVIQSRVAPGQPLCPRCSQALAVRMPGSGRATTECPQCGDRDVFAVPTVLQHGVPSLKTVLVLGRTGPTGLNPWWLLFEGEGGMREMVLDAKARYEQEVADAKARAEAERIALEELERERAVREAREIVERERRERDAREREAREREARDRAAREARDHEERERARVEAMRVEAEREQQVRERRAREERERQAREARETAAREAEAERQRTAWEAWEKADTERKERERLEHEECQRIEADRVRREAQERRGRIAAWITAGALALALSGAILVAAIQ